MITRDQRLRTNAERRREEYEENNPTKNISGSAGGGVTDYPSQEERLAKLTSTDSKYGSLLRTGYKRGILTEKQKSEYMIGVQEGIFDPTDDMDPEAYGFSVRARARGEVDPETGLTPAQSDAYSERRDRFNGGGMSKARTFTGEAANSGSFGVIDRVASAVAKTGFGDDDSIFGLQRDMAADMEANGFEGDASLRAQRMSRGEDRAENPWTAMAGEAAGYVAPGVVGYKVAGTGVRMGANAATKAVPGMSRVMASHNMKLAAKNGLTSQGRRYVGGVLVPGAIAGGIDGMVYGQTVSRSNIEAAEGVDIKLFSPEANSVMLRDGIFGAIAAPVLSGLWRGGRVPVTYAKDAWDAGGEKLAGMFAKDVSGAAKGKPSARVRMDPKKRRLSDRMTPESRKMEVAYKRMRDLGMSPSDLEYVQKAVKDGNWDEAEKVLRSNYNQAMIMIEKRLRAEGIPIERLENKIREIAYKGDSVDEFFFEIAAIAGSGKTQSLANALATVGGEAKDYAIKSFDARSDDMVFRIKKALNEATGVDGSEYYNKLGDLEARGSKATNDAYTIASKNQLSDEAWDDLTKLDEDGYSIMTRPAIKDARKKAITLAEDAGEYKAAQELRMMDEIIEAGKIPRKPTVGAFKYIDQELTDARFKASSPTSDKNPRGIAMAQDTLRDVSDPSSGLAKARDVNAKFKTAADAFEEGRSMFSNGTDVETLLGTFEREIKRLDGDNPEILPALLEGWVRGAEDALSKPANATTALRQLYGSPRGREKLEAMLAIARKKLGVTKQRQTALLGGERSVTRVSEVDGLPQRAAKKVPVAGRIRREMSMQDSKNRTIRGSQTAERLQAIREADEFADTAEEFFDAATGGMSAIIGKYGSKLTRRAFQSGIYNAGVNRELGQIMFTGGRKHLGEVVSDLKRLRSARMGKSELQVLGRKQRPTSPPPKGGNNGSPPPKGGSGKRVAKPREEKKQKQLDGTARTRSRVTHGQGYGSDEVATDLAGIAVLSAADSVNEDSDMPWATMAGIAVLAGRRSGRVRMRKPKGAIEVNGAMFMGRSAKNADLVRLAEAEQLAEEGGDMGMIWRRTGWFRGQDGEWRFEISDAKSRTRDTVKADYDLSDSQYKYLREPYDAELDRVRELIKKGEMTPEKAKELLDAAAKRTGLDEVILGRINNTNLMARLKYGGTLDEVLDHPELFDNYPQLREVEVDMRNPDVEENGYKGWRMDADPGSQLPESISISPTLSAAEARSTLLHEVMHSIQQIENFGRGGNVRSLTAINGGPGDALTAREVISLRRDYDYLKKLNPELTDPLDIDEELVKMLEDAGLDVPLRSTRRIAQDPDMMSDEEAWQIVKTYGLDRRIDPDRPYRAYQRLYGEAEARNVQQRIDMSDADKKATMPDDDLTVQSGENSVTRVAADDTIVHFGDFKPVRMGKDGKRQGFDASARPEKGGVQDGSGMAGSADDLREASAKVLPLEGHIKSVKIPGHGTVDVGPHQKAHDVASSYMKRVGMEYSPPRKYAKVDEARAKRIADEYEKMAHAPDDPEVKAAYAAMIKETNDQYQELIDSGLTVEFIDDGMPDPYAASPRLAIEDVKKNNHLWVYPTDSGFGQGAITPEELAQNPLLAETTHMISGRVARANDIFRAVHDYFGHVKDGVGFRAGGEENAWRSHVSMYSPQARRAMTSETRGQNSWVNYGPHGAKNRTATTDTVYADQKIGLLPEWVSVDGATDDIVKPKASGFMGDESGSFSPSAALDALDKVAMPVARGIQRAERSLTPVKSARHYGRTIRDAKPKKRIVNTKPLIDQVDNPRALASDIAQRSSVKGGEQAGKKAVEHIAKSRHGARRAHVAEAREAKTALRRAEKEQESFYGPNGTHNNFKRPAAKQVEERRLAAQTAEARRRVAAAMNPESDITGRPDTLRGRENMPDETVADIMEQELLREDGGDGYMAMNIQNGGSRVGQVQMPVISARMKRKPNGPKRGTDTEMADLVFNPARAKEAAAMVTAGEIPLRKNAGRVVTLGAAALAATGVHAGYTGMKDAAQRDKDFENKSRINTEREALERFNSRTHLVKGSEVRYFQHILKADGALRTDGEPFTDADIDGKIGQDFRAGVLRFQRRNGLRRTGYVNQETRDAMLAMGEKWGFELVPEEY